MKKLFNQIIFAAIAALVVSPVMTGCKGATDFLHLNEPKMLLVEHVDPTDISTTGTGTGTGTNTGGNSGNNTEETGQTIPKTSPNGFHPLFQGVLGVPVRYSSIASLTRTPRARI